MFHKSAATKAMDVRETKMKLSFIAGVTVTLFMFVISQGQAADKTVKGSQTTTQDLKKPKRPSGADILSPNGGVITLTAAECTGIGGKIAANVGCMPQKACFTVDTIGVVRKVCITGSN